MNQIHDTNKNSKYELYEKPRLEKIRNEWLSHCSNRIVYKTKRGYKYTGCRVRVVFSKVGFKSYRQCLADPKKCGLNPINS